jgi:hypothetical protein
LKALILNIYHTNCVGSKINIYIQINCYMDKFLRTVSNGWRVYQQENRKNQH